MLALLPWGKIALIAGIFLAGFGSGWQIQGWRMDAKIAPLTAEVSRLQARAVILENANDQCAKSVKTQNEAVNGVLKAGKDREIKATQAAEEARRASQGIATNIAALRATKPPENATCDAVASAAAKVIADEVRGRK